MKGRHENLLNGFHRQLAYTKPPALPGGFFYDSEASCAAAPQPAPTFQKFIDQ
jgi:hypothetical protein